MGRERARFGGEARPQPASVSGCQPQAVSCRPSCGPIGPAMPVLQCCRLSGHAGIRHNQPCRQHLRYYSRKPPLHGAGSCSCSDSGCRSGCDPGHFTRCGSCYDSSNGTGYGSCCGVGHSARHDTRNGTSYRFRNDSGHDAGNDFGCGSGCGIRHGTGYGSSNDIRNDHRHGASHDSSRDSCHFARPTRARPSVQLLC